MTIKLLAASMGQGVSLSLSDMQHCGYATLPYRDRETEERAGKSEKGERGREGRVLT